MPNWTKSQQDGIEAYGGNIIVSAAAGSGKTAVLVERVIRMITRQESPIDVDRLLIVTFTNAAAAEMKTRISSSLRDMLKANPKDKNLKKQLSLLSSASICSIDSFCLSLVKENFFELGLPSEFRVLDESESDVLTENAINSVLDTYYDEKSDAFVALTTALTKPDNDKPLINSIKTLLNFISAQAFPFDWLDSVIENYNPSIELENSIWWRIFKDEVDELLNNCLTINNNVLSFIPQDEEYQKLLDVIRNDRNELTKLKNALNNGIDAFIATTPIDFMRLSTSKKQDSSVKEFVKTNRDLYKDIVTKGVYKLLVSDADGFKEDMEYLYPIFKELRKLLFDINSAVMESKADKGAYTFSDIEHFAINLLLYKDNDNKILKTKLADELSSKYAQILVDEYQDTNEAQDKLFEYLSNGKNRFMVGDVKQSIYRFRLAMPQIFTSKKKSYNVYSSESPVFPASITLDKNFRSRKDICHYVNHIFSLFMTEKTGELDYDQSEYLNAGATYEKSDIPSAQLKILRGIKSDQYDLKEATYIARTIIEKVKSGELIRDKDIYRPIEYGDFAIMMRSLKSHISNYVDVFTDFGIPVICDNSSNLFDNGEIQMLLSLLRIIDNPMQDIDLLTLMLSPIYGFTPDELADMRCNNPYGSLYNAVFSSNYDKAKEFIDDISALRTIAVTMSAADFISYVADIKSVYAFAYAMGNGEQREQNIAKFIDIAKQFDNGENVGMTAFMRYINSIINSERSTDSAVLSPGSSNAVKIMTVHHSKGLEFPVCILAGSCRKYNFTNRDMQPIITDANLGISMKCHNEDGYYRYKSIPYIVMQNRVNRAMMSENLRVLYVAMTRAKEQFISFITEDKFNSRVSKLASIVINGKPFPYHCSKMLKDSDFLIMAALCHKDGGALRDIADFENSIPIPQTGTLFNMSVDIIDDIELCSESDAVVEEPADEKIIEQIKDRLSFSYNYSNLSTISAKRSASGLDESIKGLEYIASSKPSFLSTGGLTPAQRGTAMHTFMQYCDYENCKNNLEEEIKRICDYGYLNTEQAESLDRKKLNELFYGDFGTRLFSSDKIYREIKVSSFVKVSDIENINSNDEIYVQGIADCVFEENGKLVLVDYKTDRVSSKEQLLGMYKNQLAFYKKAVGAAIGKSVKEVYLYSFSLSEACQYNDI